VVHDKKIIFHIIYFGSSFHAFYKYFFFNFYRFPKDINLREKWVAQIKKDVPLIITQYTRLCSKHFTNDDYYQSSFGNDILKPDAVPSRFFCSRKSLLPGIKKKLNT